jgi:thioredoxin reductase (NADPH)
MAVKPVLLTVDDDVDVSRAIERDLRRHYGADYRVLRAERGAQALDLLARVAERGEPVALLLADQRMPEMTGVDFLVRAARLAPDARRVLLTAYADTEAAIRAINEVRIDYYLAKPWDPPEQNLYPYLDDLLGDWRARYRAPYDGVTVFGARWDPDAHALRDFLGRNLVAFRTVDPEGGDEARRAWESAGAPALPAVTFPDGASLARPTVSDLAGRVGLKTRAERPFYDLVVVGAGPAGLAAAVYGASEGLKTLLVEREAPGGQAGTSSNIENYLGFPVGLSGADLTRRGVAQARRFGAEILTPQEVTRVRVERGGAPGGGEAAASSDAAGDGYKVLTLGDGSEIASRVVLVATGVSYRRLTVPGAVELEGRGVYYGAGTTEASSCRNEEVYIVGGGNSAGQAAMHFSRFAARVSILVRGAGLAATMSQYLIDQIAATPNIEVRPYTQVVAAAGDGHLERLTLEGAGGVREEVRATSLFVFIGAAPRTDWLDGVVQRDEHGFVLTGPDLRREAPAEPALGAPARPGTERASWRVRGWPVERDPYLLETNVPGLLCAGDVRHQSVKRVASAVGEGAIAVQFTHRYLAGA